MTQNLQHDVVEPAARRALDENGHRRIVMFSALLTAFVIVLFGLFLYTFLNSRSLINGLHADVQALVASANDNANRAHILEQQVRELGGVPKVVASGPPGQNGQAGAVGPGGLTGPAGRDGQTPPCLSQPNQCRGVAGQNGADGSDGVNGVNGTDGASGQDGVNGADGANGQTPPCVSEPGQCRGADGKPPQGWVITRSDDTRETCVRDQDSPDTAPTYTCVDEPPQPPTTTTTTTEPATTTEAAPTTGGPFLLPSLPTLTLPLLLLAGGPHE